MNTADHLRIGAQVLFLLRSQWWDEKRIAAYQEKQLVRLMRHAVTEIPFYAGLGLSVDSIRSSDDLRRFPVITKQEIQDRRKDFIRRETDPRDLFVSRTSGSTCEPTETLFDRESWLLGKYALKIRRILSVCRPWFKRLLIISEQPRKSLDENKASMIKGADILFTQKFLSIFDDMAGHVSHILNYKPDILYAFPSYLLELADELEKRGPGGFRIPVLFTSSEKLTPGARKRIEGFFHGKVYDVYGSTEFKEVACQCDYGSYHLNFENAFVEELPDDLGDGVRARSLLITGLNNFAMPLIRFRLGDIGAIHGGRCECGRRSARLSDIGGREADLLRLSGGRTLSPYLLTMKIEEFPVIRKYQIVQTGDSEFRVDFVAYPGKKLDGLFQTLPVMLREVLGEPARVALKEVDEIVRSKSGKFKIVSRSF